MLTPERIREAIIRAGYHYARAAFLLGVSPDTFRSRITQLKARGEEFPKSRARGGKNQPPERTREEFDDARNEIAGSTVCRNASTTTREDVTTACRLLRRSGITR